MTSATSEKGIALAEAASKRDTKLERRVIGNLMKTVEGRRAIWLQLEAAGIFRDEENLDPQILAYRAGQRNAGLRLLRIVTAAAPREYVLAMEEAARVKLTEKEPQDDGHLDSGPDA